MNFMKCTLRKVAANIRHLSNTETAGYLARFFRQDRHRCRRKLKRAVTAYTSGPRNPGGEKYPSNLF